MGSAKRQIESQWEDPVTKPRNEAEVRERAEKFAALPPALVMDLKSQQIIRDLLALLAEKDKVIEKLPRTKDGVPKLPGDVVWMERNPSNDEITKFTVLDYRDWKASVWDGKTQARCESDYGGGWPVDTCYSTREAALAAREQAEEGE